MLSFVVMNEDVVCCQESVFTLDAIGTMPTGLVCDSGFYECDCPSTWNGIHCQLKDVQFPGGVGRPAFPPADMLGYCSRHACSDKSRNGVCDVSLPTAFLSYELWEIV